MKFTYFWLKRFLEIDESIDTICATLTDLGLEVEEVINKKDELKDFKVAYIKSVKPHPNASKLQICEVETIEGLLQIVCGAPNARTGIKVALAKIGSIIPNGGFKIKESDIRGIKSSGMLCSEEELGISKRSDGIIELPEDSTIGDEVAKYLGLDDIIIEINVTPNRSDALGVYGIARDLAAKGLGQLKDIKYCQPKSVSESNFHGVKTNACILFATREINGVNNNPSPVWLQKLLKNVGIKPISAVVDVTNYISYSFGQPMHAYDKNKLKNGLVVSVAKNKSIFHALNTQNYEIEDGDIIICDDNKIQCIAGIIGSASSACDENTNNIILEAAVFDPKYIAKTGQRLKVLTDSRYRFERGVDREFTLKALDIATNMILEICTGSASSIYCTDSFKKDPIIIDFPLVTFEKMTGLKLGINFILDILNKLGCKVTQNQDLLKITPPSWRHDIKIKEDIIEEIIRIHGYNKVLAVALPRIPIAKIIPKYYRQSENIKRLLAANGYDETVTWSFMKEEDAIGFAELNSNLRIVNPISIDLNYMRPSIIPNLLKLVAKNYARSIKNMSIFEVGPIFSGINPDEEDQFVSGLRFGLRAERSWQECVGAYDIYDIKSDLTTIFNALGINFCKMTMSKAPDYYHPGRSASFGLGKNILGHFGQIHPKIQKIFDLSSDVFAFELNLDLIPVSKDKFAKRPRLLLSDFQAVVRDFAFEVGKDIKAGDILNFIKEIDKKLIQDVTLFDVYEKGQEHALKSIAISVKIQSYDHTLTEQDLSNLSNKIIEGVFKKFHAVLRVS